jgi:hypothetical protein
MLKAIARFLIVLSVAVLFGASLYLAMHYVVQPLADRFDPEPPEDYSYNTRPEPIELPEIGELVREAFAVAKNGIVFVVMTVIVVGVQYAAPKIKRRNKSSERDTG